MFPDTRRSSAVLRSCKRVAERYKKGNRGNRRKKLDCCSRLSLREICSDSNLSNFDLHARLFCVPSSIFVLI